MVFYPTIVNYTRRLRSYHLIKNISKCILIISILLCTIESNAQHGDDVSFLSTIRNTNTYDANSSVQKAYKSAEINADSALFLLDQLHRSYAAVNYTLGIADALYHIGSVYAKYKRNYKRAQEFYLKSNVHFDKIPNKELKWMLHWKGSWHNNMGVTYYYLDKLDSTVYHYEKALQYANLHNCPNIEEVINTYNNLAAALNTLKQFKKAIYYSNIAENLALSKDKKENLIYTFQNMSISLEAMGNHEEALKQLSKIEKLNLKETPLQLAVKFNIYGDIYIAQGKLASAIQHYQKAVHFGQGSKEQINFQVSLGYGYLRTGQHLKAKINLETALKNVFVYQDITVRRGLIQLMHGHLASLYDSLKDFNKAYYHRTQAGIYADSIAEIEKDKTIYEIEAKYRMAEKDKDIAGKKLELLNLKQTIARKNFWVLSISSSALFLSLLFIVLYQRQRIRLHKEKTEKQQQQINQLSAVLDGEEKERARIGRQIHDDVMVEFSLAKINLAALPNEFPIVRSTRTYERVEQQLDKTGIKIRQTAHNLMPDALLTEGLLYAIDYFCNGISKTTALSISFQFFGEIVTLPVDMEINIYRIVQELVQNIVKHAMANEILIQIHSREQEITLTVEDNGKGIADLKKAENGMGIRSIRSRLKVMNGDMDLRSVYLEGTEVHIAIPTPLY